MSRLLAEQSELFERMDRLRGWTYENTIDAVITSRGFDEGRRALADQGRAPNSPRRSTARPPPPPACRAEDYSVAVAGVTWRGRDHWMPNAWRRTEVPS